MKISSKRTRKQKQRYDVKKVYRRGLETNAEMKGTPASLPWPATLNEQNKELRYNVKLEIHAKQERRGEKGAES
jgi:hypothetical protein